MLALRFILTMALVFLLCTSSHAVTGDEAEFVKVADGIYAFIGKRNDANALVIVTTEGVVLVDTGNNPPETRKLQEFIRSVTDQPVRYIVISQNHGDHQGGVPLFAPPAHIIVQERVYRDWSTWKPYQIKAWQRRFPERSKALAEVKPTDTTLVFHDRMQLHLGGREIELLYIDDVYNPGDVAVWLPQSGVMHAGFVGYRERHPDIRPDYSHGTTSGMLKQLEVLTALKPRVVVPAHGPLGDVTHLSAMTDYLLSARQKVRVMMDKGLALPEIEKQFNMNEYVGWDRGSHFPWMAETIYRELQGEPPQHATVTERTASGTIEAINEEGRFLKTASETGEHLPLRVTGETVFEGVADRSQLKVGMRFTAQYMVPQGANAALGFDVMELDVLH